MKAKTAEKKETAFTCNVKPDARCVYVAGDFNNWDPTSNRMTKRLGIFRANVKLTPGEHQYKFVVDGEWHHDPEASFQVANEFGGLNSVVRV
ncbi:MAG: glycogen-binding domain-containing protein [Kiritimatiellae bacterium]|nr:glycogen-binding domain-containing protein [Kiritimatiellia bacterium]